MERYLCRKVEELGLQVYKFVPDWDPGMPDRVILLPGQRCLWVETKTIGGRLSELQKYRHAALRKAGHDVVVVWTKAQADELIDKLLQDAPDGLRSCRA